MRVPLRKEAAGGGRGREQGRKDLEGQQEESVGCVCVFGRGWPQAPGMDPVILLVSAMLILMP